MILSDEKDSSTDDVIDWLRFMSIPFVRINPTNHLSVNNLSLEDDKISISMSNISVEINFDSILAYWYRRGKIPLDIDYINPPKNDLEIACNESIAGEYTDLINFVYPILHEKHSLGSIYENRTNKLYNLKIASSVGLKIPITKILTRKTELITFLNQFEKVITKPIGQAGLIFDNDRISIDGTTTVVNKNKAVNYPDNFQASLFQEYINKAYELRIFFLDGECYVNAIFSQLDEQTKIDFRNYNYEKPNRTPPYKLPKNIKQKIINFMNKISMKSGSIDIIVTPRKEFYFLEVNPVGQFKQVSYPCNYYLEKEIANYLSKPFKDE